MTLWGTVVALVFLACFLGQSVGSGLKGENAKRLEWACWAIAGAAMLACYLLTETQGG